MPKPSKSSPRQKAKPHGASKDGSRAPRRIIAIVCLGVVIAGAILIYQRPWRHHGIAKDNASNSQPSVSLRRPDSEILAAYAGSESCKNCHQVEYDRWAQSHHGLAERKVSPDLDKPAFDPAQNFHHGSQDSRARTENGAFQIISTDLTGKPQPQTIERVIGVDPLRQFLVAAPHGRLQTLEASYDPAKNEWFNVYGNEDRQPGEWGHWTGHGMNWNSMCAACHNTHLLKNYDEASDSYNTKMAEMSVGCEACHGPMKAHVTGAGAGHGDGGTRGAGDAGTGGHGEKDTAIVHFSRDKVFDTCGTCHARRGEITGDFSPGQNFFDHYSLTGVDDSETFYADGQVHEEDYELSAFLGSKMHAAGVRCVDCHDVHSGKTLLEGNVLCMKCHIGAFPKAPVINPLTHTFHTPAGAGSQCVNCHMPQTKYMQRHGRHDHGFTIPDPLVTKQIGIPNSCNRCHGDKDADWAIAAVDKWYGGKMDRPTRKRALAIAAGRKSDESAKPNLLAMLGEPQQSFYWKSAIIRVLAKWTNDPAIVAAITAQLHGEHPMIRESAAVALESLVDRQTAIAQAMESLLKDSSQNVRVAAAHALGARVDPQSPVGRQFAAFLQFQADQPTGQFQLAIYCGTYRDARAAAAHLNRAVQWDPRSSALRREAAVMFGTLGQPREALAQIQEACRLEPTNAEYAFLHGLAEAEVANATEAADAMEKAVQLDPHHARAWYNLALLRQKARNADGALSAFRNAGRNDPTDPQIPFAEAVLLAQLNRHADARAAAERALRIAPDYAEALQLLRSLPK